MEKAIRNVRDLYKIKAGQVVVDARGVWFQQNNMGMFQRFGSDYQYGHKHIHLPARLILPTKTEGN